MNAAYIITGLIACYAVPSVLIDAIYRRTLMPEKPAKLLHDSAGVLTLVRPHPIHTLPIIKRADQHDKTPRAESLLPLRSIVEDHIDLVQAIKDHWLSYGMELEAIPPEIRVHILGLDVKLALLRRTAIARAGEIMDEEAGLKS